MFSCGQIVTVKDFFDDCDNIVCKVVGVIYSTQRRSSITNVIVQPIEKIGEWECYSVHITNIEKD